MEQQTILATTVSDAIDSLIHLSNDRDLRGRLTELAEVVRIEKEHGEYSAEWLVEMALVRTRR